MDKSEPKSLMFACARICVEVDLEKGLPKSIILSIDGWNHLQTMDYEQIPFKCKYFHEYGHFAKSCPKKPKKPISDSPQDEGLNVASGKKTTKSLKQLHIPSKSAPENWFEVLQVETQEIETQEENPKAVHRQEDETPVVVPSHQEKEVHEEVMVQPQEMREAVEKSEGSVTRSRAKACSEEATDTSTKEQEPLSREGRKSNKAIRE